MATSGVISGLYTAREIITQAHELTGAVTEGQPASTAYDAAMALRHLNWMLKSMQADGCHAFRLEEITWTWTGAAASMAFDGQSSRPENVLDIKDMRVRASSIDRQLTRIEVDEYAAIPNKAQAGSPISFTIRKGINYPTVYIWPVPASSTTMYANVERVIEDVTTLDENVDIPQEWTECVVYKLADRLNAAGGFIGTPSAQAIQQRGDILYRTLRAADEPQSIYLSPAFS